MAVFGPQFIYTIVMFVFLAKLGKFYSLGRYILCHKLFRYLSPSSDELKKAVRNHYKSINAKNKKLNKIYDIDDDKEEFNIPEEATIDLSMSPVMPHDLYYIKYADEFQSFVDVSIVAIMIYLTTEVYISFFRPADEINLSVLWCGMIILYALATLSSIAYHYLRSSEGALLFIFAGLSFLISLLFQLADTKFFDFQLKDAYRNVSTNALNMLQTHIDFVISSSTDGSASSTSSEKIIPKHAPTSHKIYSQLKTYSTNELLFTFFLASVSGFIGALLFFPSFRLARLHILCLKYSQESKLRKVLFYLNFVMPLFVALCWFNPNSSALSKFNLNNTNITNQTDNSSDTVERFLSSIISNSNQNNSTSNSTIFVQYLKEFKLVSASALINIVTANNLKVYLILFIFILRLGLYKYYAQSYLNLAFELASSMRKTSAKITNTKYMSTISSIYQFYGVVASQYVIPLYILLFFGLLLKTLGDFSWCGNAIWCQDICDSVYNYTSSFKSNQTYSPSILKQLETSRFNVTLGHNALNKIFTAGVLRSLIGYFTFWTASIWFIISCFGLLYYQYIDRAIMYV